MTAISCFMMRDWLIIDPQMAVGQSDDAFISTVSNSRRCMNTVRSRVLFTCEGKCINFCGKCLIFFEIAEFIKICILSTDSMCVCAHVSELKPCWIAYVRRWHNQILQQHINFQMSDTRILMTSKGMYDLYAFSVSWAKKEEQIGHWEMNFVPCPCYEFSLSLKERSN